MAGLLLQITPYELFRRAKNKLIKKSIPSQGSVSRRSD